MFNVGVLFNIDQRWGISASVTYLPIKTTATFQGSGAGTGTTTTGQLKLNPTDYVVRLGYKF